MNRCCNWVEKLEKSKKCTLLFFANFSVRILPWVEVVREDKGQ
jgi:hypothetical protein